jgi:hypothetical protein
MRASNRLVVAVTFDAQRGYVASGPGLESVAALSLFSLRARIEAQLPPATAVTLIALPPASATAAIVLPAR